MSLYDEDRDRLIQGIRDIINGVDSEDKGDDYEALL